MNSTLLDCAKVMAIRLIEFALMIGIICLIW